MEDKMKESINSWRSTGEKPTPKGERRSKNYTKPTGHIQIGLKEDAGPEEEVDYTTALANESPQHIRRTMNYTKKNWRIIGPLLTMMGLAFFAARNRQNKKHR
jgi:hypothetical protein